ncbi:MAG: hypothetical protein KKF89_03665 [Nanoarchaeota archaeon]|nr:hypothetical protein [Nanoarchaeota archaeon]MBU1854793.1 hypothetical protein [Nanoarchaeota archaeon]
MKSIVSLKTYVDNLSEKKKELFHKIFSVSEDTGFLTIPKEMKKWVISTFGSVKIVEKQKIIRVDNNITCETALFNELRAMRPLDIKKDYDTQQLIKEKKGGDFCNPKTRTACDVFGRIKGKWCITGSNIAKYESMHGLIIFNEHNPLKFSSVDIKDYLETANKWIRKVNKNDSERNYPYVMWNCLWKAGGSIVHGHMQMVVGKKKHYGSIERLRRLAEGYNDVFKTDYYEDLFQAHKMLGLGFEKKNVRIMAHLTPAKEKEVLIISNEKNISEAIYKVLKAYLKMGVESFNVGLYLQPLDKSWEMPVIARIVDRGKLSSKSTDIAGMELFAGASVISSDPYIVLEKVKKEF